MKAKVRLILVSFLTACLYLSLSFSSFGQTGTTTNKEAVKDASQKTLPNHFKPITQDTTAEEVKSPRYKITLFAAEIVDSDASKGKKAIEITALDQYNTPNTKVNGEYPFTFNGSAVQILPFTNGKAQYVLPESEPEQTLPKSIYIKYGVTEEESFGELMTFPKKTEGNKTPLLLSLIPPLIAILLALWFKEAVAALFLGVWAGAFILNGFGWDGFVQGFLDVVQIYIIDAVKDPDHIAVIVFSLMIGGMVAIISRNGGMRGVVNGLSVFARGARSSQLVTWIMGIAIFFDDYANTLIVGNTMRSVTDKFRVSREKLAYIVDSTAAPVAAIALITTWIGAELDYINGAIETLNTGATDGWMIKEAAYSIFLNSLQYSFYPIFTLFFILMIVLLKRDYGPMLAAERRARTTGQLSEVNVRKGEELSDALEELEPVKGIKHFAFNAILPVMTVIGVTIAGLLITGWDDTIMDDERLTLFSQLSSVIGASNSYTALLWSSSAGVLVAIILSVLGGFLSLRATMDSFLSGVKTMMGAMVILILAWSLAQVTQELHTAEFLTGILENSFDPRLLPLLTFALAGIIAFSTGSSWSTMAILYPIILPLTWALCKSVGFDMDTTMPIFYNVTSSVLAGAVFGDHCSPISDTTILSSLASQANHVDHVTTQMPYAITVALVSLGMSALAMYMQLPFWMLFLIGLSILLLVVLIFGRTVPEYDFAAANLPDPTPVRPQPTVGNIPPVDRVVATPAKEETATSTSAKEVEKETEKDKPTTETDDKTAFKLPEVKDEEDESWKEY